MDRHRVEHSCKLNAVGAVPAIERQSVMPPMEPPPEYVIRGRAVPIDRKVWTTPAMGDHPTAAVVFLDAELYVERVGAAAVLHDLQRGGAVPPATGVFVSHNGAAARHEDFTCRADYATFVARDVVRWVTERNPSVRDVVLAGLSLSGLAAAFVSTRFPGTFRATICQSPSFWWDDGRFGEELCRTNCAGERFWVCVGDQETDVNVSHPPSGLFQRLTQIEGCEAGRDALRRGGCEVSYRTYAGGHDPRCWREDLILALPWALRGGA
jgi:enterochelin esterase family protein